MIYTIFFEKKDHGSIKTNGTNNRSKEMHHKNKLHKFYTMKKKIFNMIHVTKICIFVIIIFFKEQTKRKFSRKPHRREMNFFLCHKKRKSQL